MSLKGAWPQPNGEKGYDLLIKRCNWKTIVEKTFKVYEK